MVDGLCGAVCVTVLSGVVLLWMLSYFLTASDKPKIKRKAGKPNLPIQFDLKNVILPTVSGWPLVVFGWFVNLKVTAPLRNFLIRRNIRKSNGYLLSNYFTPDTPTFEPVVRPTKLQLQQNKPTELESLLSTSTSNEKSFSFLTIAELVDAYRTGQTTPLQVTENALAAIEKTEKMDMKLRAFVQVHKDDALLMARESTKRYAEKKPLSIIDGIPVGLKECFSVTGYHTRSGTVFLGQEAETQDCNIVVKLRELGCVILGLTNMHEIGAGVTGNNPNHLHGTPRNPYNLNYHTGGSSSGSACAVSAGICPVTIGTDGGGSIRIPAAVCGVVGIKATYGRITAKCQSYFGGHTVAHPGPLCGNVRDTALMYALLSGPDDDFAPGLDQPEVTLDKFENVDLSDLKIGIHWQLAQFADQNMVDVFNKAVEYLKSKGATIQDIEIPEMEELRVAHMAVIGSELNTGIKNVGGRELLNSDTAILMSLFDNGVSSADYLLASRQKTRSIAFMKTIFADVDCILTPATGCSMVEITDTYEKFGLSSGSLSGKIMRFSVLGNFTGIPGLVVPFDYEDNGLPIGVQVMTSWWDEHVAFRVAHCLEQGLVKSPPHVYFNILDPSKDII